MSCGLRVSADRVGDADHAAAGGQRPDRRPLLSGFAVSLAVLTAASFVSVGFSANAPLIQRSLGLSHSGVGAIASAVYAAAAVTSRVAGRYTDRVGPGPVLVAAMAALAGGVLLAVSTRHPAPFFAGVAMCGLGYGAVNPPTNVLANPPAADRRGLAMSGKQSGIPLGGILAGIALPPAAAAFGWRWSMALPAVMCLALVAISLRVSSGPGSDRSGAPGARPDAVQLRLPRAYSFGFLMAGVQVTVFAFLAVYLTEARGLGAARAGALLALLMAGGLVGRPLWGWASDRHRQDRVRVLQAVAVLSGAGLVLVPVLPAAALPILVVAIGLFSVGWNGVFIASVGEVGPASAIGASTGLALVGVNIGAVIFPPAFGVLVARSGWTAVWTGCAVLSLLATAVLQVSRRHVAAGADRPNPVLARNPQ